MKDEVLSIGIYGMGGVGKTTLMSNIFEQLLGRMAAFENAFWLTLPQNYSVCELHRCIAKAISLDLSNQGDQRKRAVKLSNGLIRKRKDVMILDDLWEDFDFHEVGLPKGMDGCKLIPISRRLDVCRRMGCKKKLFSIIGLLLTGKKLGTNLFRSELGKDTLLKGETKEIAECCIARGCDGLPLGIITMARIMRENGVSNWKKAFKL